MTLADELNKYEVTFTAGQEPSLEAAPEDDSLFDSDGNATDPGLVEFLNRLPECLVYFDFDPRERQLGLVCWVERDGETAWFCTSEAYWCPGEV